MSTMTSDHRHITPPFLAGPARRALHTVVAVAGWVLFIYWWWIVARRVGQGEIRSTVLFIVISLAVIVLLTIVWAFHNKRISDVRGPRAKVRTVTPDFSHDGIGRVVEYRATDRQTAPIVYVRLEQGAKVYTTAPPVEPAGGPSAHAGTP
jgi:hypothetical protein